MTSNYPPGVTGNEPQITGEWPVDPHAPFDVLGDGVGESNPKWIVVFGNEEDPLGGLEFDTQDAARKWADDLNRVWPKRSCEKRLVGSPAWMRQCPICGDFDYIDEP